MLSLNGDINTGILIRTTYLRDGVATYPGGGDAALRFGAGDRKSRRRASRLPGSSALLDPRCRTSRLRATPERSAQRRETAAGG